MKLRCLGRAAINTLAGIVACVVSLGLVAVVIYAAFFVMGCLRALGLMMFGEDSPLSFVFIPVGFFCLVFAHEYFTCNCRIKPNIPKRGASRKLAAKLRKLGNQRINKLKPFCAKLNKKDLKNGYIVIPFKGEFKGELLVFIGGIMQQSGVENDYCVSGDKLYWSSSISLTEGDCIEVNGTKLRKGITEKDY